MDLVEKKWGYEEIFANDTFSFKKLVFQANAESSYHRHRLKDEAFYVLSGRGTFILEGNPQPIHPGLVFTVPRDHLHKFIAGAQGMILIEAGTPHRDDDVERLTQSRGIV